MKDHYINILLFALPLNILVYNQRNYYITPRHTETNRSLCECELYAPANYDSDPEMKRVMQQFVDRTTQRFHEYDERMKTTRQKCKDKCDKEIQKIILKDKLEKQMAQELITLETKITTEDIPTCICEKSLADKTEKFCLNCSKNMGAIAPWWGLVCGTGYAGWSHYVPIAVAKAAMDAGMNVVINVLKTLGAEKLTAVIFKEISSIDDFTKVTTFADIIQRHFEESCAAMSSYTGVNEAMATKICSIVQNGRGSGVPAQTVVSKALETIDAKAKLTANTQAAEVTANYTSTTSSLTNTIIASVVAVVVIVLIMIIIYLILHYRRKKKMKKKLQYIKLLEE